MLFFFSSSLFFFLFFVENYSHWWNLQSCEIFLFLAVLAPHARDSNGAWTERDDVIVTRLGPDLRKIRRHFWKIVSSSECYAVPLISESISSRDRRFVEPRTDRTVNECAASIKRTRDFHVFMRRSLKFHCNRLRETFCRGKSMFLGRGGFPPSLAYSIVLHVLLQPQRLKTKARRKDTEL